MTDKHNISWPGWETVGMIGRGSFGAVYEIQRSIFGDVEKAALKVISIPQNASDIDEMYNDGYDDESITSTFQNHLKSIVAEYSLMRKMSGCANIVNCDDVRYVQHGDGIGWDIFIKMELLTPLAKALPENEETVEKLAKDICTALNLCQKYSIVHRDIKPQNIFVSSEGGYKLGDFGIAKTVERTMGGTKIGTYKFMAPEVYNNQPYGTAADIYSLGLVLYWLLNERRMPFLPLPPEKLKAGMEEEARYCRLSGEQFPAPKNGSAALKAIVMKACSYDPKERYRTAQEMLDDLNGLHTDGVIGAASVPQTDVRNEVNDIYADDFTKTLAGKESGKVEVKVETLAAAVDESKTGVAGSQPEQPQKAEAPKKKNKFVIAATAVLAVIALVCVLLFSGKDAAGNNAESASSNTSDDKSGNVLDNLFNNASNDTSEELFEELLYGSYSMEGLYSENGAEGDYTAYLTDMEFCMIPFDVDEEREVAVLPYDFQAYPMLNDSGNISYDYLSPSYQEALLEEAIAEYGEELGAEYYQNYLSISELDRMVISVCDRYDVAYNLYFCYRCEGRKLILSQFNVDETTLEYTLTDVLEYDIYRDGTAIVLSYNGIQSRYLPREFSGWNESVYYGVNGCISDDSLAYNGIMKISLFGDYDRETKDKAPGRRVSTYIKFTDGGYAIEPIHRFNDDGTLTISWEKRWQEYNGRSIEVDDPTEITCEYIWCGDYGIVLIIDGKYYLYQTPEDIYEENKLGGVDVSNLTDEEVDEMIVIQTNILQELITAFDEAGIDAQIDQTSGRVTMDAQFLFDQDASELSADGKAYLDKFVDVYSSVILSEDYADCIAQIVVEGHTDDDGGYDYNLKLSESRAAAVYDHCVAINGDLGSIISTKGCSYKNLIYNEDGTVNKDASRRVTFRFVLNTPND